MHAALYDWKSTETVESFSYGDLVLPRQSSFARKEALLLQTLDYLGSFVPSLSHELNWTTDCARLPFQAVAKPSSSPSILARSSSTNTPTSRSTSELPCSCTSASDKPADLLHLLSLRLAELLSHHSRLSESIVLEQRPTPHYFLVSYFGPFPSAVRNRQFIYRGADWEKYGGFTDRLQSRHPSARLLKSIVVPDVVRDGQDLVIQVVAVVPEPDRSKSVLRPEVPKEIRAFHETKCVPSTTAPLPVPCADGPSRLPSSNIKHFSYSRPFSRTGSTDSDVDPADTFVERVSRPLPPPPATQCRPY